VFPSLFRRLAQVMKVGSHLKNTPVPVSDSLSEKCAENVAKPIFAWPRSIIASEIASVEEERVRLWKV
jgi:hypothetical protein